MTYHSNLTRENLDLLIADMRKRQRKSKDVEEKYKLKIKIQEIKKLRDEL